MPTADADIAAAARRVAEHARSLPRSVVHAGVAAADLLALLPVLDAVGTGGTGAEAWRAYETARDLYGRVERMLGYLDEEDPEDAPYIPHAERELKTDRTALDAIVRRLAQKGTLAEAGQIRAEFDAGARAPEGQFKL